MGVVNILLPVFSVLVLGFVCRLFNLVSKEEKQGIGHLVFNVLFPLLIVSLLGSASLDGEYVYVVGFVFLVFVGGLVVGKFLCPLVAKRYSHFGAYLLTVVEGGNVALPLYVSLVGASINTVIFDIAALCFNFVVLPLVIAKECAVSRDFKDLVRNVVTNGFVIAVVLGLFLNFSGLYEVIVNSVVGEGVLASVEMLTKGIVPLILFVLGYDFRIERSDVKELFGLLSVKVIYSLGVIGLFYVLFPGLMADRVFMLAVVIYFMCPTGFGLFPVIAPLYKSEADSSFTSAFVSVYMLITLAVYGFAAATLV